MSGVTGAVVSYDASTSTYTIGVPAGTDVKTLKLAILISANATISPDPTTARDYTNPVTYTVKAEDGSTQAYTVRVQVQNAPKSSEKLVTGFTFAALSLAVSASIDQANRKITATIPTDANLTSLVPTIMISAKATVSPASGVAQNFTNPVNYTTTAEDGSKQVYEVRVEKQTPTTPTGGGCLVSRIEQTTSGDYVDFVYDTNKRIVKILYKDVAYIIETDISYNTNNEVTLWKYKRTLTTDGKIYVDIEFRATYSGNKVTKMEPFDNGVVVGQYTITANDQNQITNLKGVNGTTTRIYNLTYANGNPVKYEQCFGADCEVVNAEYDSKAHFLKNDSVKGIWGFLYAAATGGLLGAFTAMNNPTETNSSVNGKLSDHTTYAYEYNSANYPINVRTQEDYGLNTSSPISKTRTFKITYSNCQ